MHRLVLSGLAMFALPVAAFAQSSAPGVQVGVLRCEVEGGSGFIFGSTKDLGCVFDRADGKKEGYKGTINKFGLDIGKVTQANLVWAVLAPSADMKPSALNGNYAGVSAGATLGVGLEANALIGGLDRSIALNPLSVAGTEGIDIQAGVASLSLSAR